MHCSLVLISTSRSPDVIFLAEKFFPTMDSSVLETRNGDSFAKGFSLSECITRNLGNFSADLVVLIACTSVRLLLGGRSRKVFCLVPIEMGENFGAPGAPPTTEPNTGVGNVP